MTLNEQKWKIGWIKYKPRSGILFTKSPVLTVMLPIFIFYTSTLDVSKWHNDMRDWFNCGWFRAAALFSPFRQTEQTDSSPPVSPAHLRRMADPTAWSSRFNASLTCRKAQQPFPEPSSISLSLSGWPYWSCFGLQDRLTVTAEWCVDLHKLILVPRETCAGKGHFGRERHPLPSWGRKGQGQKELSWGGSHWSFSGTLLPQPYHLGHGILWANLCKHTNHAGGSCNV